jgi:hypothetical protein
VHGPQALFAIEPGAETLTKAQLMAAKPVGSQSSEWQVATGRGSIRLKPFPAIANEHYRLYHNV